MSLNPFAALRCENEACRRKGRDVKVTPDIKNTLGQPKALCSMCWANSRPDERDCRGK